MNEKQMNQSIKQASKQTIEKMPQTYNENQNEVDSIKTNLKKKRE